ncbi:hypothetical protein Nepgr_012480 [Nepenthes gracilis]|uniref:Uncharacterized protein n=1 Tax=Nepenthes gracilis TaxID=150966 RepID=A0AAD3SHC5_NEPGR|nr:hypothetical protein Nepgr_012480 [Nepenthes gracilis]
MKSHHGRAVRNQIIMTRGIQKQGFQRSVGKQFSIPKQAAHSPQPNRATNLEAQWGKAGNTTPLNRGCSIMDKGKAGDQLKNSCLIPPNNISTPASRSNKNGTRILPAAPPSFRIKSGAKHLTTSDNFHLQSTPKHRLMVQATDSSNYMRWLSSKQPNPPATSG